MWKKAELRHSSNEIMELYCLQCENVVTMAFCENTEQKQRQLIRISFIGQLDDLVLNQYNAKIEWILSESVFDSWPCENDLTKSKSNGTQPLIDCKYYFSTAIDLSRNHRYFNRQIKKFITGVWKSSNETLHIEKGNSFSIDRYPENRMFSGFPTNGKWSEGGGSLLVVDNSLSGVRMQIVDINENQLVFGGEDSNLFYELEKQS